MSGKLLLSITSTIWQFLQPASMLVFSALVVKMSSSQIWGEVVSMLVFVQLINGIAGWGNREYLQREFSRIPGRFEATFNAFNFQRIIILIVALLVLSLLVPTTYILPLSIIAVGRFLYQSLSVKVIIEKRFIGFSVLELLALGIQIIPLFLFPISILNMLYILAIASVFKGLVGGLILKFEMPSMTFEPNHLRHALFFGLMSISGMFLSRFDIVMLEGKVPSDELGSYQILMTILLNIQAASLFLTAPFLHHFYRMSDAQKKGSSSILLLLGIPLVLIGVAAANLFLRIYLNLEIPQNTWIAQSIFAILPFVYVPQIYRLNGAGKERYVLISNLIGFAMLIILFQFGFQLVEVSLSAAVWLMCLHQLVMALLYFSFSKWKKA